MTDAGTLLAGEWKQETPSLRVFVLDENQLLAWMARHLCPPGTEVVGFTSFDEARRSVLESPPDAAVVSITSAHVPWREFQELCARCRPPVPVLYESRIYSSAREAGLEADPSHVLFLGTPAPIPEFAEALAGLLGLARDVRSRVPVPSLEAR